MSQAVWEAFRFNFLKGDGISDWNISQDTVILILILAQVELGLFKHGKE